MAMNPSLVIRVAANVEEFKRNLAQGRDLIETTTASMGRLANSLRGDKIVQQAHNIVAAIDKVGGTAKLTVQEAARLEPTLAKAVAKMELMGRTVPTAMRAVHAELKGLADQAEMAAHKTSFLDSTFGRLAGAFSVGMWVDRAISGVVALGVEAFRSAGGIQDLSVKLGVSMEAVQRWTYAAKMTGATVDDISRAVVQMSDRLATGDTATVAALTSVGLSLAAIRARRPEEAFQAIASAVAAIKDPMEQTRLALDLFGKSGADILPAIREGLLEIGAAAPVMADQMITELDRAEKRMMDFLARLKVAAGSALALMPYILNGSTHVSMGRARGTTEPAGTLHLPAPPPRDINLPSVLLPKRAEDALREFEATYGRRLEALKAQAEHLAETAALRAEAFAGSVQAVAARMGRVVTVLQTMAAEQWTLSKDALKGFVNEIDAWLRAGYRVPDVLGQMWRGNLDLVDSIKQIPIVVPRAITALTALGQAGRPLFPHDFLAGFTLPRGLPPGASPTVTLGPAPDSRFDAERAAQQTAVYASLLTTVSVAMRNLGTQGSTAWKFITAGIETATASLQAYVLEQDAAKKAQAALASASQGAISLMIAGYMKIFSLFKEQREKDKQFAYDWQQIVHDLQMPAIQPAAFVNSAEWQRIRDQFQQTWVAANPGPMGESSWQQMFRYFRERLTQLKETVGDLGRALHGVGGFVPPSLQPMLDELLQSSSLTDAMRQQLEGLAREPSWTYMQERAEALGISLAGLGARFQQAKVKDIALGYVRDLAMFETGAADMTVVLDGMKDELSAIAQQAVKTGALLPATLKPYLQRLADVGALIDENGNKIDLGALSFKEMEDETLTAIKTILQQIRDLLAGLPAVAGRAGQALKDLVLPPPNLLPPDARAGYGYPTMAPPAAVVGPVGAPAWAGPAATQVSITIQAWDGASVDQWLARGGDRRLAQAVAHVSRELGYA